MAKLIKSRDHIIAGVCGGIAEFLGWDKTVTRVVYAILTLCTCFSGIIIYIILWIVMPSDEWQ